MKKLLFILNIFLLVSCSGTKTVSVRSEYIDDIYYNPYYSPHYNHFYDYFGGYPIIYNSYPTFMIHSPRSIYTRPGNMYKYNQREQIKKYRSNEDYKKQYKPRESDNKQHLNTNGIYHQNNNLIPNENKRISDIHFDSSPQRNTQSYSFPQRNNSGRSTISNSGRR